MKKKNFVIVFIMFFVGCIIGFLGYPAVMGGGSSDKNLSNTTNSEVFTKVDYPLIEIAFTDRDEWLVINRTDLFTEQESFHIIQNHKELQFNKECLSVLTFPVGRGTTPSGIIYVYKNNELIKEVPYFEVYFEKETFREEFQETTKAKIEDIIGQELPAAI